MNARQVLNASLAAVIATSAVSLLVALTLCFAMPADWEYRGEAEGVRKICFLVLAVGSGVRGLAEYQAKKRAKAEVAAGELEPAPSARRG